MALATAPSAQSLSASDMTTGGQDAIFAKLANLKSVVAAGKGKIALQQPDTRSSARWAEVDAPDFELAFKAAGLTPDDYIIENAQGSPTTQQTQAEQAVTQGASVIVITDLDNGSGAAKLVQEFRVPNWDNQVGETMFQQAFQAHPEINAVLAANDGLAQSAIAVLKNNKVPPKTVPMTGQDATLQGAQNILAGYQCMTVYKPIYEEVAGAAALAIYARAGQTPDAALLNGEGDAQNHKTPALLLTPASVNASNMQATLIKDKFIDPAKLCSGDFKAACDANGIK
jgi:ABC-type xylose transport system substrate-binding protein